MKEIKKLVESVVFAIVDDVSKVQILEEETEQGVSYEITVAKDDVGKLIGKEGRVASALRTIAKASGAKHGTRVLINVINKPLA